MLGNYSPWLPEYVSSNDLPALAIPSLIPWWAIACSILWPFPALLYDRWQFFVRKRRRLVLSRAGDSFCVFDGEDAGIDSPGTRVGLSDGIGTSDGLGSGQASLNANDAPGIDEGRLPVSVLYSSLEHKIPGLPRASGVVGGLGKVTSLIANHHPTDIIMVHPMLDSTTGQISYEPCVAEDAPLDILVDGRSIRVRVFHHTAWPQGTAAPRVDVLLLSHPIFEARTSKTIYPSPMTRLSVLRFYSLWNQSVAALIVRHRPHIFHCPDFHSAVAPWYTLPAHPDLRVVLVLHNAEYQGAISTDMMRGQALAKIAQIFNLPPEMVQRHLVEEGRFNMLKSAVCFVLERQQGFGVFAVSGYYAQECYLAHSIFWRLPSIKGLDNPMLESERPTIEQDLTFAKAAAKQQIQEQFHLHVLKEARIFVCLGRLVRQKGVDLLADVAHRLLSDHPEAQLIVIGPIGDGFGFYAKEKLDALRDSFPGQLYTRFEFWKVPPELMLAADFCLMPSRDEPFGYVDIEFAWHGAVMVGAQAGGLGKVPGFYYIAQNRENLNRLRTELWQTIEDAMGTSSVQLAMMSREALNCDFPLSSWQRDLSSVYSRLAVASPLDHEPGRTPARPSALRAASALCKTDVSKVSPPLEAPGVQLSCERHSPTEARDALESGSAAEEFLMQELDEEELFAKMESLIRERPTLDIVSVLEAIGSEINLTRETHPVSRWLLGSTCGVIRIHIAVSCGFCTASVASLMASVQATEWTSRWEGDIPGIPEELTKHIPTVVWQMLLFMVSSLAFAVSMPVWTVLCQHCEPRKVMAANLLLRAPVALVFLAPIKPHVIFAMFMMFLNGVVSSGSFLLMVFNFMMTINADQSRVAIRMGVLEIARYATTWVMTAYIMYCSPTSVSGTQEDPYPWAARVLMAPMASIILLFCLVPGLLLLFAPGPYRDDRFPGWDLQLLWKKKSYLLLSISDCIGSLGVYMSTTYIVWWIANGWATQQIAIVCLILGLTLVVGIASWALCLGACAQLGKRFLVGIVLLLGPAQILRAIAQEEVSFTVNAPPSRAAAVICIISLLYEAIRASAMWTAKISILNSRWRFLSYSTVFLSIGACCEVLSPGLAWVITYFAGRGEILSLNAKGLADAVIVCTVPFFLAQYLVQVLAAPYIYKDLGVAEPRGIVAPGPHHWLRRNPSAFVVACGMAIAVASSLFSMKLTEPPPPTRVLRCRQAAASTCTILEDVTEIGVFGPNAYGQNTSGKAHCLWRMRDLQGDTFAFWGHGRCQVQRCGREPDTSPGQVEEEVWSTYCSVSHNNFVFVHLFEWRWEDVATECEEYLGPAGFDAVQVSPPQEHILGDSWATRYQPVSYILNSRSGDPEAFIDMVQRCRRVGVNVMVDAVLNHMAGPYIQMRRYSPKGRCDRPETAPGYTAGCTGWNGTVFGDREFLHAVEGNGHYGLHDFHHFFGNDRSNCGWGGPLCDMMGLPDLNTEMSNVQLELASYLQHLYAIGVTFLRLDAGMWIYPDSVESILSFQAWDYVVQEYTSYTIEWSSVRDASVYSHVTDFVFGNALSEFVFDSYTGGEWVNRTHAFQDLLTLNRGWIGACDGYQYCKLPVEPARALHFVDNHDQQRERWKEELGGPPSSPVCMWDMARPGICRPIYKHGMQHLVLVLWMLAWPLPLGADSVRVISSYAWTHFAEGPPGVENNSLKQTAKRVYTGNETRPSGCRSTPAGSPVADTYDNDTLHPWICEHRWEGIAGFVRLRKLLRPEVDWSIQHAWGDPEGRFAYALAPQGSAVSHAFVALSRGFNTVSRYGPNASITLKGRNTGLPAGQYCNLAVGTSPFTRGAGGIWNCASGTSVVVDAMGRIISKTLLPAAGALALHVNITALERVKRRW